MNWKSIESESQLKELVQLSYSQPVLIYKHSSRCGISSLAKKRLENNWKTAPDKLSPWYLDLIQYRIISNKIAETFDIRHESPQILLIQNGDCTYHASHLNISVEAIAKQLAHSSLS